MRLTWKDAAGTLIVAAGLTLALSVTQGWAWPLLGDARAGIVALGITAFVACPLAGSISDRASFRNPFVFLAAALGLTALIVAIIGLFANAMPYLVWLMILVAALWLVATVRHLVEGVPSTRSMTSG